MNAPDTGKRTRIISVGGGKGGVGKSVVSSNLAVAMAQMGKRVVLADMDLGTANQHLLLGVDQPKPGVQILLDRRVTDARAGLSETRFPNLQLLASTGASLGVANLTYNEKMRLLRRLRQLDADVVLVDVGAGVGYNALDFFELGAQRLVVTTPQVTAIHDAYSFLKGAVLRTLHHHMKSKSERAMLKDAETSDEGEKVVDILARLRESEPDFHERVLQVLKSFGAYLVGNQVSDPKQTRIFHAVSKMMQEYLGLTVPILGWLESSDRVAESVNRRRPIVGADASKNGNTLREMAETLLLEDVVMEEDLLALEAEVEIEVEGVTGDDGDSEADDDDDEPSMTPAGLELPAPRAEPEVLTAAGNPNYLGDPRARVYQPPQRKKKPRRKKRDSMRRRRITLPGMTPGDK